MREFKKIINTKNLIRNYRLLKKKAGAALTVPVVKADAYGHSVDITVRALLKSGVNYVAVAYAEEALYLKKKFPDIGILVMGIAERQYINELIRLGVELAVGNIENLNDIDDAAKKQHTYAIVHLKLNTGMNRLGFSWRNCRALAETRRTQKYIRFAGLMSHFACSDIPQHELNRVQIDRFSGCSDILEATGMEFKYRHICNSGGLLNFPIARFSMVRTGIALYGCSPGTDTHFDSEFTPVMEIHGTLSCVKRIQKGDTVGYGAGWSAPTDGYLGVVPIGYGDGYPRHLSDGKGTVIVNDKRYPVCGKVCMDQLAIFASNDEFKSGDPVCLLGTQANQRITADDLAHAVGTNSYEILCGFLPRLPTVEAEMA